MILGKTHVYRTLIDFDLLDAGAVVHHPNYLVLCERARTQALSDAGYSAKELWNDGVALAVIETKSRYLRPLGFGDQIAVLTRTESFSKVRLSVRQNIFVVGDEWNPPEGHGDDVVGDGSFVYELEVTLSCVKLFPLRSTRLPHRLISALTLSDARSKSRENEAVL